MLRHGCALENSVQNKILESFLADDAGTVFNASRKDFKGQWWSSQRCCVRLFNILVAHINLLLFSVENSNLVDLLNVRSWKYLTK